MPWWAASNQPSRREVAPVKAPTSWPNSSLSASCSLMAPQFTATNGPSRPDSRCTWRATSSLPVPLSPSIRMGAELGATRSINANRSTDAGSTKTSDLARIDSGCPKPSSSERTANDAAGLRDSKVI